MRPGSNRLARPLSPLRPGAALFALAVVLQLLLPSLHALGQRSASTQSSSTAAAHGLGFELRGGSDAPVHQAESCPQCQSFAQARGHAVPAQGASPSQALEIGGPSVAANVQRLPAAPDAGSGSPRAPPSVLSSI
jgi:hypothetical protein